MSTDFIYHAKTACEELTKIIEQNVLDNTEEDLAVDCINILVTMWAIVESYENE